MTPDILSLVTPIEIQCPPVLRFGSGLAPTVGEWAREQGFSRVLVVADAFNARRVETLALPGRPAVFGTVKPEPDIPNLQALLAKLAAVLSGSEQSIHEVGPEKVRRSNIALVQVPTSSGTGSEAGTAPWSPTPLRKTNSPCRAGTCWRTLRWSIRT